MQACHLHTLRGSGLTMLITSLCFFGIISLINGAGETATFEMEDKLYTLHVSLIGNNGHASIECQNSYDSTLAVISSYTQLQNLNNKLEELAGQGQISLDYHETWVGGRTDAPLHSLIDLNDPVQIPKEQGSNCVALSDYSSHRSNVTTKYNLYSKLCTEEDRRMLCEKEMEVHITSFRHGSTMFSIVINQKASQQEAQRFCHQQVGGASLALINEDSILLAVDFKLVELTLANILNKPVNELWLGGKTDTAEHQQIQPDSVTGSNTGDQCLILSDWKPHNIITIPTFKIYSKHCGATDRNFICALKTDKYIYMESPGLCPMFTHISRASIYVSQSGCRELRGLLLNSASPEGMVLCQFDICTTDSRDAINGVLLSSQGHCPGDVSYQAYITAYTRGDCEKMGGRLIVHPDQGSLRMQCSLDICRKTKTANYKTLLLSTQERCGLNERAGSVAVFTDSERTCQLLGGQVGYGAMQSGLNQTHCQLILCHMDSHGCKKSQIGKAYTGDMSVTLSGRTCQRWDSQYPHPHSQTNALWFPDATLADASNYCRNPADWMEGPFCYTTDPTVPWEICNIPFCPGSGLQPVEYQVGLKRYIFLPGQLTNPKDFCEKTYNAHPTVIKSPLSDGLSQWLIHLISTNGIPAKEIWVGGRIPRIDQPGIKITNYQDIVTNGQSGSCLLLSNWNQTSQAYDGDVMNLYTGTCPQYYRQFLCEMEELKINNYEVSRGSAIMQVHEMDDCMRSCKGTCWAAGFHELEESCWHYTDIADCQPGRSNPHFQFFKKADCGCHELLVSVDSEVSLSASSVCSGEGRVCNANQGRLTSQSIYTKQGLLAGAWMPAVYEEGQWIQARFSQLRMVYGIVTLGLDSRESQAFVRTYRLKTSERLDCEEMVTYGGEAKSFAGNVQSDVSATVILESALMLHCVRICPLTWNNAIALRFDVLGCTERPSIALGKPVYPSIGQESQSTQVIVDGFTWGDCVLLKPQSNPWMAVDLLEYYEVEEIVLYTPTTSIQMAEHGELKQLSVNVMMLSYYGPKLANDECAFIPDPIPMGEQLSVTCAPPKTGRIIFIQKKVSDSSESLALCEIKVQGKKSESQVLSENKPVQQSSTGHDGDAFHGVDGNFNNNWKNKSCTHTNKNTNPWWLVDLEEDMTITSVLILGRGDCCGSRIHDLFIYVGDSLKGQGILDHQQLCESDAASFSDNEYRHYQCQSPINGRYVKVILQPAEEWLTLCEVLVFGHRVLIPTYSGNTKSSVCSFPFVYNGEEKTRCITEDRDGRYWCSTTPNYDKDQLWGYCQDLRLTSGRLPSEGLVYVRGGPDFSWSTVCDDGWDDSDATVACKALGYPGGRAVYPPYFGQGAGNISVSDVQCEGGEKSLLTCPHTQSPPHCAHHEDAAVSCHNPDAIPMYGNPDIMRSRADNTHEGTVILPENQAIAMPGKLTSWNFYSSKNATLLALQIWRRVFDLKGLRFVLIGSTDATTALDKDKSVHVQNAHPIQVQTGDRIGFSFCGGNPVPYDHTFHCSSHGTVNFRTKPATGIGSIHSFPTKKDQNIGCRLYSMYANVETHKINVLKQFDYNGNSYRVFTTLQTKLSADTFCQSSMGQGSEVLVLEDRMEFEHIRGVLSAMQLNGTFWIANSLQEPSAAPDWAPCQPEEGKECLTISNNNKDGRYLWYSKNCDVTVYFICEVKGPESSSAFSSSRYLSTASRYQSTVSPIFKTQHSKENETNRFPMIIAVSVVVPAVIAALMVLLALYIRKLHKSRANLTLMTSRSFMTESTCPLTPEDDTVSVVSIPSTGSVSMHMNKEGTANEGFENPAYGKITTSSS